MRKITSELSKVYAQRFSDFLLTQGIDTAVEPVREDAYEIWAKHEDQLVDAKSLLKEFLLAPDAEKYRVDQEASELKRRLEKEQQAKLKLQQKFKPRSSSLGSGTGKMTIGIIAVCVVASLLTGFGEMRGFDGALPLDEQPFQLRLYNQLTLVPQITAIDESNQRMGPMDAVLGGQVWRLITPIFLHGSVMHLVFNCLFIFSFGKIIEAFYGPLFLGVLFLVGGIVGLFFQVYGPSFLGPSANVIGASGGALALFSFLWIRPRFEPSMPFRISQINVIFVLGFVFIAMIPAIGIMKVAHLAHLGGLIWGASVATGFLDFLKR